jgi:hypothetical protein
MPKPEPKFSARSNYCAECRTDISHLAYNAKLCIVCAKTRRDKREKERQLKIHLERANRPKPLYRIYRSSTTPCLEYYCQNQSADGKFYIINFKGKWLRIAKVCQGCKRTDELVRGQWAPIYSITDVAGNEVSPVLLCLNCYKLECKTQTTIAS